MRAMMFAVLMIAAAAAPAPAQDLEVVSPIRDVSRLAEIIGEAHYLRITCNNRDDQYWRQRMMTLMQLEAPQPGSRRTALVNAFNQGFRRQEGRFRSCTREVREAEVELAAQGRRLARSLQDRYLN